MNLSDAMAQMGHEQIVFCHDARISYHAIVAIHSTVLGPAVGGTRLYPYRTEDEALLDALRLSRGMTQKNAAADLPFGGGKAVIIGESGRAEREPVFRAHGRFIERLSGRFITGEDVGTSPEDMEHIRKETSHVGGLAGRGGDPSPWTARGVLRAMKAAAKERWGSDSVEGRLVAIQGCGHVGRHLAKLLKEEGARIVVADPEPARVEAVVREAGATSVEPAAIYDVPGAIFAPCALGGVLNEATIPRLAFEIVAGAANNQLRDEEDGRRLLERDILYAPDFVANAGGIIRATIDLLGWEPSKVSARIDGIYDTMRRVLEAARRDGVPPSVAADRLAEERIAAKAGAAGRGH
jgi:leucine dehydrogenase